MERPNINLGNQTDRDAVTLYGNQKLIVVMKAALSANDRYIVVDTEHLCMAMRTLTYNEFRLYLYLASNVHGYAFGLSRAAVTAYTHMSSKGYDDAVSGLIDKGYLTLKGDLCDTKTKADDRTYYFTTVPMTAVEDPSEWMRWCAETNSPGFVFDDDLGL